MKLPKTFKRIFLLFLIIIFNSIRAYDIPFSRGVNLTSWFQTNSPKSIQFTKYTRQDLINIKSLGGDVIRLPINLHSMTLGAPDYQIDPILFVFLDEVVNWAEELDIHLILDNHSFDPSIDTDPNVGSLLIPIWKQFAEHYKSRSKLILYEILNEPHGIDDNVWNTIQQSVIDAIREIDSIHTIIVGPAGWNSYNNLIFMPEYSDTNLIYTFHFYDPFIFTHQGASWTDPSLSELKNVPFPYEQSKMPTLPSSLSGTWISSAFNNYFSDGTEQKVKQLIDVAVNFKESRGIKIFCGEFGVYMPNSNNDDRVAWYELVRKYFEEKGISWTIWDYQGAFGLFERGSMELFNYDLNIPLTNALGFNLIEQGDFVFKPDSLGFALYDDFIEAGIKESSWSPDSELDYYNTEFPADGFYSIFWKNATQYSKIGFDFTPDKDLSYLALGLGAHLKFYLKGDTPNTVFDIRFIDTKTDSLEDHPWRMRYTIDESIVSFDNTWHLIDIPLSDFTEQGSWDNNTWFTPVGLFDWHAVDVFEIVAEQSSLSGIGLWFDKIEIIDPNATSVKQEKIAGRFNLAQNYPNPFNPITIINFELSEKTLVRLSIFNLLGQKIKDLVDQELYAGIHKVAFNGENLSSGVYICLMNVNNYLQSRKMILMK